MTMHLHIGTKIIKAKPMNRQQYNDFRGWKLPENENGEDEGYLVEYTEGGVANTAEYKGYVSWSPKEVFEKEYQPDGKLSFGGALKALKQGHKVMRNGWNGKNLFISLKRGVQASDNAHERVLGVSIDLMDVGDVGITTRLPHLEIYYPDGTRCAWLASQTDMLADDWAILH